MNRSDEINELAAALATAQGSIKTAAQSAVNPAFHHKYATLTDIIESCREPLSKNGLALIQTFGETDGTGVSVETTLLHKSGQWIASELRLPVAKLTPQDYGSAITYARKYSVCAMVGVVSDEDDDGNAASARPAQPQPARNASATPSLPAQPPQAAKPVNTPEQETTSEKAKWDTAYSIWRGHCAGLPGGIGNINSERGLVLYLAWRLSGKGRAPKKDMSEYSVDQLTELNRRLDVVSKTDLLQWQSEYESDVSQEPEEEDPFTASPDAAPGDLLTVPVTVTSPRGPAH